jgi:tripartite-type tricarboxylate transporter receptor subunit TctC
VLAPAGAIRSANCRWKAISFHARLRGRAGAALHTAPFADPNMKARLADLGGTVLAGSPADFGKLIAEDTEKWGKVIRAANIKPE